MKYLMGLVAIFLCSGVSLAQTDEYISYISADKEWYIDGKRYTFSEDSILQGQWYRERMVYDGPADLMGDSYGLYREEGGKVYQLVGPEATDEELVFDFTLVAGDTVAYPSDFNIERQGLVVAVDTVTFADDVPRKRIQIDCFDEIDFPVQWVEGIGHLYDVSDLCFVGDVIKNTLFCYYENGIRVYEYEWIQSSDNCYQSTAINVEDELRASFSISPNPAETHIVISGELPEQYAIYDMVGRLIASAALVGDRIPVAELQSGVHVLVATDHGGSVSTVRFEKL